MDVKLRWNYTEGDRYTSGFMMFCNLASSGVYSPTPTLTDYDFAYKLANSGAKKFDLLGVNPVNRYSFSIAPYAITRSGISYGTFSYYDGGNNPPGAPNDEDWIDFQGSSSVNFGVAPRTQVNIVSETDSQIVLEFVVTSASGETATTYYRLTADGSFSEVTEAGGTQLTVQKSTRDVTVYYYSEGDTSGNKESVLEFVIDINRTPTIVAIRSEFEISTQEGIVYWYGDDDVERVDWDVDGGPTYITSGQSGNTGWFGIPAGQSKDVTMLPRGRGHAGTQVVATVLNPARSPRVQLNVVERRQDEIDVEYEVEGFGDSTVVVYSKVNDASFAQVSGTPPAETISRDASEVYLYYFASGTTTGLVSNVYTFSIDVDRIAEISDTAIEYDYNQLEYTVKWWGDDDTTSVRYKVNTGGWYIVSGQSGITTPQSIVGGQTDNVALVPYGPTGSGIAVHVYPTLPPSASSNLPPYIVISGASDGSDGGGAYVLVNVYSYNSSGTAAGSIEYAEGSAVWTDAGVSNYQHKVYRPVVGETFSRYRAYIGNLYSDTVVFSIDVDDVPEIRPNIDLSADQTTVRIEWQGDDDVASVEITPSGVASRVYNLQAGVDEITTIGYGETKNFTIQPFDTAGATGKEGKLWPLRITRPASNAPWIAISKQGENTSSIPATVTLQFDAEASATNLYWNSSGIAYPGGAGWTGVSNGGTQVFNRPAGDQALVVRAYAANGTAYSPVVSYTIDVDEIPTVTSAYYDPDWENDQAELYWSVDDDADYVQLYQDGGTYGSPIAVSTTHTTITGMVPNTVKTFTIVPKRGSAEFPQNAKTVVIARAAATLIPTVQLQLGQSGSTGTMTLVINDPDGYVVGTSFEPVSGGIGSPASDPASWSNYDNSDPYNLTDDVALVAGHTSVIYWGVAYDLGDGNGTCWITGAHTFDFDTVPHVMFQLTQVDDDAYISWIGDEDTQSIRVASSYTSMPTSGDLDVATSQDGRVGYWMFDNGGFDPGKTLYVRARGYGSTSGAGTAQEVDFQGIMKFEKDLVPGVKVIAYQTSGGSESNPGTGVLSLTIDDPHGVVSATAFHPLTVTHDASVNSNPASWSNVDTSYPYTTSDTVSIGKKHNAKIYWGVRYTINSVDYWITGDHTYDADTQAEINNIGVSYNSSNYVVVSVAGDEDCDDIYITVGVGSTPSDPTSGSNHGSVASNNGIITSSITASMGATVNVKARGYNSGGDPGPVKTARFVRGHSGNQPYYAVTTPSQTGSTGEWQIDVSDPTGVVTNMQQRYKAGTAAWSSWSSTGWDDSSGNYGDSTVMRQKNVSLTSKHTSSVEIKVYYDDANGTSRSEVYGWTFDADEIAEVTNCSLSFDSSDYIVVTASGDEDTASLHFRVTGNGSTPGDPDGTGSDSGSISGRSGTDTTSVTCATGATAKIKIRGYNGSALGPIFSYEVVRENVPPALSGVTLFVEDTGTNNIYTVGWNRNSGVSDITHDVDIDFYENNVYVGSSTSITPSDDGKVWTDTGAGDGGSDKHYAVVMLRSSSGILQSLITRVVNSAT